jgi:hypothetical protein
MERLIMKTGSEMWLNISNIDVSYYTILYYDNYTRQGEGEGVGEGRGEEGENEGGAIWVFVV